MATREFYRDTFGDNKVIFFGLYGDDVRRGEMRIEWENLLGESVPRLKVYNDGWAALVTFSDVLWKLADLNNQNATMDQIAAVLTECGFKDTTNE